MRPGFTPCKVPPNKLAAGLGDTNSYTGNLTQYAAAGYVIWGSKWSPHWGGCK